MTHHRYHYRSRSHPHHHKRIAETEVASEGVDAVVIELFF